MYRTAAQIESIMQLLEAWFPQYVTRINLPETSVEGRTVHAMRLRAGGGEGRRGVLFVGGTHARELMNPDAILELAIDMIVSYINGSDIVYGGKTWPARTVELILETLDLWLLPCSNPDGRHYVMTVDDMWRKNRRDNPGTTCDGVDLNRNLDILWGVLEGQVSCNPCSDVYCGPSAFSEPETRNVKYLLDTRHICCFVDVHSYSELVLYPWGHAPTQTTDPSQRFTTLPSGTCSGIADPGYEEYMTPRDKERFETVAQRVVDAITPVRGRVYTPQTSRALYATTGTHGDYAYSRHIADPSLDKTYGFTFETGPYTGSSADSFHPANPDPVKMDGKSGMLELARQCICAIELIGADLFGRAFELSTFQRVRDEALATTEAGRSWITLYESVQGAALEAVLEDEDLAKEAGQLLARASEVIAGDAALEAADVKKAGTFLKRLGKSESPEVREATRIVAGRIDELKGKRASKAIEQLMAKGPREKRGEGKTKKGGSTSKRKTSKRKASKRKSGKKT